MNQSKDMVRVLASALALSVGACGEDAPDRAEVRRYPAALSAGESQVFFDDFGAGLGAWIETGEGDWNTESLQGSTSYPASGSGAPAAHSDNCDTGCSLALAVPIDLSTAEAGRVELLRYVASALDAGEFLTVEAWNGNTWVVERSWGDGAGDDSQWHLETIDLGPYLGVSDFALRFQTQQSYYNEHVMVDDVRVILGSPGEPPPPPPPPAGDFEVQRAQLEDHVRFLASQPRPPGSAHLEAARQYCAQRLSELGYQVEQQVFGAGASAGRNIVGVLPGPSSEIVMVSAHVDHIANCAGADDNASGVAGALESARLLAEQPHTRTVVVACWDQEEAGLLGARAYAQRASARGDNILVNLVYEAIGYKRTALYSQDVPGGRLVFRSLFPDAYAELRSNGFRGDFIGVAVDAPGTFTPQGGTRFAQDLKTFGSAIGLDTLTIELTADVVDVFTDALRSDHSPFWDEGYSALMITDTAEFRNPGYHCREAADEPGTLDYDFMRQVVQATSEVARKALN